MAERSLVDFIEEWQTGAFLVVSSALSGIVLAMLLGSLDAPFGRAIGFVGGTAVAFLAFSYVLYGR